MARRTLHWSSDIWRSTMHHSLLCILSAASGRQPRDPDAPTPETHVRCPECREVVRSDARVYRYCGCKLIPQ